MADKDFEITNLRERLVELEEKIKQIDKEKSELEHNHKMELREIKNAHARQLKECEARYASTSSVIEAVKQNGDVQSDRGSVISSEDGLDPSKQLLQLEQEKERWKTEYELLLALNSEDTVDDTGETNHDREYKMKEFFYQRINELTSDKQEVQSLADSLAAEVNMILHIKLV